MHTITNPLNRWLTAALAVVLTFITALPAQADETITYIHWDALGSPVAATDEGGNVVWREGYRPYGERINHEAAAGDNSRWYTGHPQDADTGLVYAGARYYDPTIGRFLGIDPVDFQEDDLHSFNRYAYVSNNPYGYIDPDGRAKVADAWRSRGSGGSGAGAIENWGGAGLAGRIGATNPSTGGAGANVGGGRGPNVGSITKNAPDITTPYKRPSGATTKAQRESVQNKPCVDCGTTTSKQVADHKNPLVKEYYQTGTIDKAKMRSVDSVQPHCPTCSARQGADMSRYSRRQKEDLGL